MTFFRSNPKKTKRLTSHKKPSPTYDFIKAPDSARDSATYLLHSVKMPSLFASLLKGLRAGMTVEASIVLPLFLFFFMSIGSYIEMVRLHGNLQLALWRTGSELTVYGGALNGAEPTAEEGKEGAEWWQKLAGAVISSTLVKERVVDVAGREYLNDSPLTEGTDSLLLWESEVLWEGDEIDLVMTYSVTPDTGLTKFFPYRMANRYYGHVWNGYAIPDSTPKTETVFVAENASVYHLDGNCTHLRLSIRQVGEAELPFERNRYGRRYIICEKCGRGAKPETFYISEEGDRYHYRRDCPGLKRTVQTMPMWEAATLYPPCKRCGRKE